MKCLKCGLDINPGEKFCKNCGAEVVNSNPVSNEFNNNYQNTNEQVVNSYENSEKQISDEYLIKMYIGEKYDKFINKGFSINTLFFGYIYSFYRKTWLYGILMYVVICILNFLVNINVLIMWLLTNLCFAIPFKKYYLKLVANRVEKIKNFNQEKNQEELGMICQQKGGTTVVPIIVLGIASILIFAIIMSIVVATLK